MRAILIERDRRAQIEQIGYLFRYSHFFEAGTWEKAISFAADVWAATVIVEAGSENAGATTRQIREQLEAHGRTHGYERTSLRAMICKAQTRVKLLEETLDPETGRPYWSPFSVSSDG